MKLVPKTTLHVRCPSCAAEGPAPEMLRAIRDERNRPSGYTFLCCAHEATLAGATETWLVTEDADEVPTIDWTEVLAA